MPEPVELEAELAQREPAVHGLTVMPFFGGERAPGEVYNVTYLFQRDADVLDTWYGRYLDRYEKRGEEWRIIERVCVHEGTTTEPVARMDIDAPSFRQGAFDRPSSGRPVGP